MKSLCNIMAELVKFVFALTLIKLVLNPSLTVAAYDPSFGLNDICEARCDHRRIRGYSGPFTFGCDEFNTEEEWDNCRNDCIECPTSVCSSAEDPNTYHCPETQLTGECKEYCDQNRPNGTTDIYQLYCTSFETSEERKTCRRMCYTCPNYVCDFLSHYRNHSNHNTVFNCPVLREAPSTTVGDGPSITEDPGSPRPTTTNTVSSTFSTTKTTSTPTLETVQPSQIVKLQSPDMMPLPIKISGRSLDDPNENDDDNDNGTVLEDVDNPVGRISRNISKTELTYEGPCKARCDKFRLGGTKEYDFKCDDLFETDEERKKCKKDCISCPKKICPRRLNYVFICPKSNDHVDSLELGPLGMVFLITTVILSFVCVTLGAFYCCRRSRQGRLLSEEATTSGHQIEYLHHVPQQRQRQQGNQRPLIKIVSSDSIL